MNSDLHDKSIGHCFYSFGSQLVILFSWQTAVATVRAGSKPTKLARLPKDEIFRMMDNSPEASDQIIQVAKEWRAENLARRQPEVIL